VKAQQQALAAVSEKSSAVSGILGDLGSKFAALAGPAAIGFAMKQTLDYADTLTKMSDRTGIGVVALQRLEAIAKPSGNSIEDLAGSINKFQKNLADGDQAAAGAIQRIGLSVSATENALARRAVHRHRQGHSGHQRSGRADADRDAVVRQGRR
jgi:hypothetical protein